MITEYLGGSTDVIVDILEHTDSIKDSVNLLIEEGLTSSRYCDIISRRWGLPYVRKIEQFFSIAELNIKEVLVICLQLGDFDSVLCIDNIHNNLRIKYINDYVDVDNLPRHSLQFLVNELVLLRGLPIEEVISWIPINKKNADLVMSSELDTDKVLYNTEDVEDLTLEQFYELIDRKLLMPGGVSNIEYGLPEVVEAAVLYSIEHERVSDAYRHGFRTPRIEEAFSNASEGYKRRVNK